MLALILLIAAGFFLVLAIFSVNVHPKVNSLALGLLLWLIADHLGALR